MFIVSMLVLACSTADPSGSDSPPGPQDGAGSGDAGATDGGDAGTTGGDGGAADGGAADGGAADGGAGDGGTDEPSDYIYDEDPVQPDLTLDEVGLAVSEAVSAFVEVDPADWFAAYQEAASWQDDDCPYYIPDYQDTYGYWYWYDACTSGSGASYSGYAYGVIYDPLWSGDYYYHDYGWIYGDFASDLPDGQSLDFSGYSYNYRRDHTSGQRYWYASMTGDVVWTGPDFAGTWLSETWSLDFTIDAVGYEQYPDYSARGLSGGISGLDGTANAIYFSDVWFGTETAGSTCPDEPSGLVRIRDDAGEWYELLFHGPAESGGSSFPEDCDGCGEVWFRGTYLGDACPSFTPLHDWNGGLP